MYTLLVVAITLMATFSNHGADKATAATDLSLINYDTYGLNGIRATVERIVANSDLLKLRLDAQTHDGNIHRYRAAEILSLLTGGSSPDDAAELEQPQCMLRIELLRLLATWDLAHNLLNCQARPLLLDMLEALGVPGPKQFHPWSHPWARPKDEELNEFLAGGQVPQAWRALGPLRSQSPAVSIRCTFCYH